MLPATEERVEAHTADDYNRRIRTQIEANLVYYAHRLDLIDQRLAELDREWDIERTLETNASAVSLAGLVLSLFWRKMAVLPIVVAGFLLQHAVSGWCPPVPLLRRAGVRTTREINQERFALKALRGDFNDLAASENSDAVARAAKALAAAAAL